MADNKDEQLREWREAQALAAKQRRNKRGKRRDPYKRGTYLGILIQPPKRDDPE